MLFPFCPSFPSFQFQVYYVFFRFLFINPKLYKPIKRDGVLATVTAGYKKLTVWRMLLKPVN